MNPDGTTQQDCLASVLTPAGRGAVATIAVTGAAAAQTVDSFFAAVSGRPLEQTAIDRIVFGSFRNLDGGSEDVVVRHISNGVEIHCHGGRVAAEAILQTLVDAGATSVAWQDSWYNSDIGSIEQAAGIALANARTERVAAILLDQYRGALRQAITRIQDLLAAGDQTEAEEQLSNLHRRGAIGLHLAEPWSVVLTGPPNVGKSSLVNAILGYSRAIVRDVPGTTRDVVTASTAIDGWPVVIADTAGLRSGSHAIEAAGIALAKQRLETADCVLLVFDQAEAWTDKHESLRQRWPEAIVVMNKCDLSSDHDAELPDATRTCALDGQGLPTLLKRIAQHLVPAVPQPGTAVPFTQPQGDAVAAAIQALARQDMADALFLCEGLTPDR